MSEQSKTDQILDLLLDALLERQVARDDNADPVQDAAEPQPDIAMVKKEAETETEAAKMTGNAAVGAVVAAVAASGAIAKNRSAIGVIDPDEESIIEDDDLTVEQELPADEPPPRQPTIHLERLLWRMVAAVAFLVIAVNLPFNTNGTTLARAMPDEAALIIRDGLLVKGEGDEIYVLDSGRLRWIATLDAFHYYGYRWENVHEVDAAFLQQFEEGTPLYLLQKCAALPHVYAIEHGHKRWIKDLPTFEELGVSWEEVQEVSCNVLRHIPDGVPIPPDAGEPPEV